MSGVHQLRRPAIVLRAKSDQILRVRPVTLPVGRVLADWDDFVVTVRTDPNWRRKWFHAANQLDPYYDTWESVLVVSLTAAEAVVEEDDEEFLQFPIAAAAIDLPGGFERYALDVRGTGGDAGEVPLVDATRVTILPRVG